MNRSNAEGSGVPAAGDLISKLCNNLTKDHPELTNRLCENALSVLSSTIRDKPLADEQYVISKIHRCFLDRNLSENIQKFDLLYARLQKTSILQNRYAVLTFLMHLSFDASSDVKRFSMLQQLQHIRQRSKIRLSSSESRDGIQNLYTARSGTNLQNSPQVSQSTIFNTQSGSSVLQLAIQQPSVSILSSKSQMLRQNILTEAELMADVLFCFQGIEGRILKKEPGGLGFVVDSNAAQIISPVQRGLLERLSNTGFLHNQVKQHCDEADKQIGVIGQALIAIFREELRNYYQTVSTLEAQLKNPVAADHLKLTLRRMLVWMAEHLNDLQWLAYIAEQCTGKRGGALISAIHGFLQHGSLCVQELSSRVLSAVCRPLYYMLSRWLLDGELNDPCGEFFIEAKTITSSDRLWHDKYYVRAQLVPSFITKEQAKQILATGKSINFLRQICKDTNQLPGREALQKLFSSTTAEALYAPERSIELHSALESVYRETSRRVLDMLIEKYRLLEHLQALRRYLLLGQGDFIRHLLELLAPELNKPAKTLYNHTLSAILESAIRVTNAQYEDEEILQRLNVGVMDPSHGDTGWDVFYLVYSVNGPIGTILGPAMTQYRSLFGSLWKAKRMEFVLSNMRKQQISIAKLFKHFKELQPIMHSIHLLSYEMIHFMHQTQYYFLFEVLECSWAEMLRQVNHAESLDDIINAHSSFLKSVQCGVLLDGGSATGENWFKSNSSATKVSLEGSKCSSNNSKTSLDTASITSEGFTEMCNQLRIIYNLILNLESIQENLFERALRERNEKLANENRMTSDKFLLKDDVDNKTRVAKFNSFLNTVKSQIKNVSFKYSEFVKKYLRVLSSSSDLNLQLLSDRLNFNKYYNVT